MKILNIISTTVFSSIKFMNIMFFGISSITFATLQIRQLLDYIIKARKTYYMLLYLQLTWTPLLDILQYLEYCTNNTSSKWVVFIMLPTGLFNGFISQWMKFNDTWTHEEQSLSWIIANRCALNDLSQLEIRQIIAS